MRILIVILGTFLALFGLVFGGCAIGWTIVVAWQGMPDAGIVCLVVVNVGLAAWLLRAAYRLFRGPARPPDGPADDPGP